MSLEVKVSVTGVPIVHWLRILQSDILITAVGSTFVTAERYIALCNTSASALNSWMPTLSLSPRKV